MSTQLIVLYVIPIPAPPPEFRLLKAVCSQLLQFLLESLPHCGDGYPVVFKVIVEFCQGNTFISMNDKAFLLDQLKDSNIQSELDQIEGRYINNVLLLISYWLRKSMQKAVEYVAIYCM